MVGILTVVAGLALTAQAILGASFLVSSIYEKERRAAMYGGLQCLTMLAALVAFLYLARAGLFETRAGLMLLIGGLVLGVVGCFMLMRRTAPNPKALQGAKGSIVGDAKKPDERATVFSRTMHLMPGSEECTEFYKEHPELEECDAGLREGGGPLMSMGMVNPDRPHEAPNKAAIMASALFRFNFATPDKCKFDAMGMPLDLPPEEASERVKGLARNLGAALVGITEIDPLWFYSHRGMSSGDYGKEIEVEHKYAIVIAMEMKTEMIGPAPHTPGDIESLQRYADGIFIATQLAAYIGGLGYSATANHVAHYEAVLPPLAADAGLGEVGRIGYLMTKEYGPRIRLGAVTTDLPMKPDRPIDIGVKEFCDICEKCATCCPSGSIPLGEPVEVNGSVRWKLNAESCFEYWGKVGSGCTICMRVCPWSHERTFPHKVITELVSRNKTSGRLFSYMDDVFYGKRPSRRPAPAWAEFEPRRNG